jgi:hypothetical protein
MVEIVLVIVIVAGAAVFVGRSLYHSVVGATKKCYVCDGGCPFSSECRDFVAEGDDRRAGGPPVGHGECRNPEARVFPKTR